MLFVILDNFEHQLDKTQKKHGVEYAQIQAMGQGLMPLNQQLYRPLVRHLSF